MMTGVTCGAEKSIDKYTTISAQYFASPADPIPPTIEYNSH